MKRICAFFWAVVAVCIPASWWIGRHESRRAKIFIWVNSMAYGAAERAAGRL